MSETKFLSKYGLELLVKNLKSYIQTYTLDNTVIVKGDADKSAILKGEYNALGTNYSNKTISQVSTAIGAAVTAGLKGWYYTKVNLSKNLIWLSNERLVNKIPIIGTVIGLKISTTTATTPDNTSFNSGWKVGDEVTIVNNKKYERCAKIADINGNMIKLDKLPFDSSTLVTSATSIGDLNEPDEFSITAIRITDNDTLKTRTVSSYDKGGIDFGGGANAVGVQTYALNIGAHAEGIQTVAYGQYSHTEGFRTEAAYVAHAEGRDTKAIGEQSHTEGKNTVAIGNNSHAEGEGIKTDEIVSLTVGAHGRASHVEGIATTTGEYNEQTGIWSKGDAAHAEGNSTIASGNHSHSEGSNTVASGWQAHAEGHSTVAKGNRSHTEGSGTETQNLAEHAQGCFNKSNTNTIHSVGIGVDNDHRKNAHEITTDGKNYILGIGDYDGTNPSTNNDVKTVIDNIYTKQSSLENSISSTNNALQNSNEQLSNQLAVLSNSIGSLETALNASKLTAGTNIEILDNSINVTDTPEFTDITLKDFGISKTGSIKDNFVFIAGSGTNSGIQINGNNKASNIFSFALGCNTQSSGQVSIAQGYNTLASGNYSHAEGNNTVALGDISHAEGYNTTASGNHSHAEGTNTKASGWQAHAEGHSSIASGNRSHAEGSGTETQNLAEHAQGCFNKSNTNTIHSVGIGTSDDDRKNAHEILSTGKHYIYNLGGYNGTNPFSSKDLATILSNVDSSDSDVFIVKKTLEVNGETTLKGAVTLGDAKEDKIIVNGDTNFKTDVIIDKALNVDGNTMLNSTLEVAGATTLNSAVTIDGSLTVNGIDYRCFPTTYVMHDSETVNISGSTRIIYDINEIFKNIPSPPSFYLGIYGYQAIEGPIDIGTTIDIIIMPTSKQECKLGLELEIQLTDYDNIYIIDPNNYIENLQKTTSTTSIFINEVASDENFTPGGEIIITRISENSYIINAVNWINVKIFPED